MEKRGRRGRRPHTQLRSAGRHWTLPRNIRPAVTSFRSSWWWRRSDRTTARNPALGALDAKPDCAMRGGLGEKEWERGSGREVVAGSPVRELLLPSATGGAIQPSGG